MRFKAIGLCLVAVATAFATSNVSAETVQTASNLFHGMPYLYVEAESYASLGADPDNNGWTVVSKENPITSNQGLPILPSDSNVSGTALLDQIGGGGDTALYEMKFITAGTYQLFTRHSMYDSDGNNSVGNEDSVYLSPAFNKNSSSDWDGFEGLNFDENDINVDIPDPGHAVDPAGWKPDTGNSANDGWFALRDWGVKSAGAINFSATPAGLFDGNFNWYNRPFFVDTNSAGGFASDYGFKTEYTVTPDMVGQTVTFELGSREPYGVMDGFLFIQTSDIYPDMDVLDIYTQADLDAVLPQPLDGDYNGNGKVDAPDYVVWRNGDSPDSSQAGYDLWRANFGNSAGSGAGLGASSAVPEPGSLGLLLIALAGFQTARNRRIR